MIQKLTILVTAFLLVLSSATASAAARNEGITCVSVGSTQTALYDKFRPVIQNSFSKVGADQIWTNLITKYNTLPLTNDVNPDLTDYVTTEALEGVYTMIAVEEKEIRNKISSRSTDLLKKVFALQD